LVTTLKSYVKSHTNEVRTLNVWDIDDTLFTTDARVIVKKDGKQVKKLEPGAYNTYNLKPGESFDFSEFRSGKVFRETAKPINSVLDRAKEIVWNQSENSKSIILTARSDFKDKEEFLQTFRDYGFPIDHVYVERAGNIIKYNPNSKASVNKGIILKRYMSSGKFDRVRMWDDSEENLNMLFKVAKMFPKIEAIGYLVTDGKVTKYKNNMNESIEVPKIGMTFGRSLMPQIRKEQIPAFLDHLKKQNISYNNEKVSSKDLKATQMEFNLDKVMNMMSSLNSKANAAKIIISNDDYILDGHHRWLADYNDDKNGKSNTIRVDLPILELMRIAKDFDGSHSENLDGNKVVDSIKGIVSESIRRSTYGIV